MDHENHIRRLWMGLMRGTGRKRRSGESTVNLQTAHGLWSQRTNCSIVLAEVASTHFAGDVGTRSLCLQCVSHLLSHPNLSIPSAKPLITF